LGAQKPGTPPVRSKFQNVHMLTCLHPTRHMCICSLSAYPHLPTPYLPTRAHTYAREQAAKQQGRSRMGVSNLCKVFAASLLRHSNDLTTVSCPPPLSTSRHLPPFTGARWRADFRKVRLGPISNVRGYACSYLGRAAPRIRLVALRMRKLRRDVCCAT